MKKQIIAVALASMLGLMGMSLVACGGSNTNKAANNTTNAATNANNNNNANTNNNNSNSNSTFNTNNSNSNSTSNSNNGNSSGLSQSQAEEKATNFLEQVLSNKAGNADVSKSTYQFTNVTGSSSEGYTFTGEGTLCDSNGSALAHGASYSFEIKVSPDGDTDLRNFDRGN